VNDELQRRINEHVLNGDAPSIIWAMEGQIRINTELEAKLAALERREALLTAFARTLLELEAFKDDVDRVYGRRGGSSSVPYDGINAEGARRANEFQEARRALTDAGFPWTKEPTT
jgi:hypothetical protein